MGPVWTSQRFFPFFLSGEMEKYARKTSGWRRKVPNYSLKKSLITAWSHNYIPHYSAFIKMCHFVDKCAIVISREVILTMLYVLLNLLENSHFNKLILSS